jgi:hypothetical protein
MKLKRILLKNTILLLICVFAIPSSASDPPKRVRGVIVGYIWGSMLLVRTKKKQYVVLQHRSSGLNPIPETVLQTQRIWDFAVEPISNCNIQMSFLRFQPIHLRCGNEYPEEEPDPTPTPVLIPYPQVDLLKLQFKNELDAITDETTLPCYKVNFGLTKPDYKERLLTGVVLNDDNQPIPEFPVSIGFSDAKVGYLFVLTDAEGRFSIPVYEKFTYWIKAGRTGFEEQKEYKATYIPKKVFVPPLKLKLEY